jgi:hydroxymethylpyrimidine/phosphomethylpyrimidine kinase
MPVLTQRWVWELAVVTILVLVVIFQSHRIDRWRGLVSQQEVSRQLAIKDQEILERDHAMEQLQAIMLAQERAVAEANQTIAQLRSARPVLDRVMTSMKEKVVRDEALVDEALRVLGVPVRLAQRCD